MFMAPPPVNIHSVARHYLSTTWDCCCAVPTGPGWSPRSAPSGLTRAPISCRYGSAFHAADRWNLHAAHHLSSPGLRGTARGALERDFAERVAAPKRAAIMAPGKITACLICGGATDAVSWTCRWRWCSPTTPTSPSSYARSGRPSSNMQARKEIRDDAERRASSTCCAATPTWWCWPAACIVTGHLPTDQHPSLVPAGVHGCSPVSARQRTRRQSRRRKGPLRSPRTSMKGRSSNKTSCASITAITSRTSHDGAPTPGARCSPGPCCATAKTASSDEATRPPSSEG